ncbi:Carbohydrate deacetylase [bacterium HR08]|nr:Carbohydrate deacetylase [bacterium HR08]
MPPGGRVVGKYLIVTADDFGFTPGINRAILQVHVEGIVTSASLMAVGPAFEDALVRARSARRLGLGVHLVWVDERPVSAAQKIPTLVNAHGRLHSLSEFLLRLHLGLIRRDDLERETRAQLERVLGAGIRPTHVDSHKHLHVLPPLLDLILGLLQEYGIGAVRLPRERVPFSVSWAAAGAWPRALAVTLLAERGRRRLSEAGVFFPDHFFGLFHTGALTEPVLLAMVKRLPEGVSELMCHPGCVDEALRAARTRLRSCREEELRALTSPAVRDEIRRRGVCLVTYEEAAQRHRLGSFV